MHHALSLDAPLQISGLRHCHLGHLAGLGDHDALRLWKIERANIVSDERQRRDLPLELGQVFILVDLGRLGQRIDGQLALCTQYPLV